MDILRSAARRSSETRVHTDGGVLADLEVRRVASERVDVVRGLLQIDDGLRGGMCRTEHLRVGAGGAHQDPEEEEGTTVDVGVASHGGTDADLKRDVELVDVRAEAGV